MSYRFLSRIGSLLHRLPSAIPSSCALCGIDGECALCADCRHRHFTALPARCRQCGLPLSGIGDLAQCGDCLRSPPAFDATVVANDYVAPIDHLVLALKFGNRLAIAPLFADLLRDALLRQPALPMPELMTVVPLSRQRLAERGFNQSLEIARPLSRSTGIALLPQLLERTRETRMQASLPPPERQRNVRHAFSVTADMQERIAGKHLAVLDDVMTTGATLAEIAALLKRHGAARVTNLAFARTPPT